MDKTPNRQDVSRPKRPTVSVIIPVFNCRETIDQQLDGLDRQTYRPVEVIISDNGSTDGLCEHIAGHPLRDRLSLRLVDSSQLKGSAYARNVGAKNATGELLAFCDADDVVKPTWLERLVDIAPDYDLVGSTGEAQTLNSDYAWRPPPPIELHCTTKNYRHAAGFSLGVWPDVYRQLDGMDERFGASQDVEFSIRAQKNGYRLGFILEELVAYRYRTTFRSLYRQGRAQGWASEQLFEEFGPDDFPPLSRREWIRRFTYLVMSNPGLPIWLTGLNRREWMREAGFSVGKYKARNAFKRQRDGRDNKPA